MGAAISLSTAKQFADQLRYRWQHKGLAAGAALITRAFHFALDPKYPSPTFQDLQTIDAKLKALLDEDLANAEAEIYPRDYLLHFPLVRYTAKFPELALDYPRAFWKKIRNSYKEMPKRVDAEEYPSYYLRNFHWQTDGWLSRRSAKLYDAQVEILFGGTADIMRRMAIPPLVRAVKTVKHPKILDLACGTGSFLRFLPPVLPEAKLYGLDLSPYYIAEAEARLSEFNNISLVTENAEATPFLEGMFDAVTCVFLFHELPTEARRKVLKEAFRVLKPGGTIVLSDSAQLVEASDVAYFLNWFPRFYHEPFFTSYLKEPLEDLLKEAGFTSVQTSRHYVSKVVTAKKA